MDENKIKEFNTKLNNLLQEYQVEIVAQPMLRSKKMEEEKIEGEEVVAETVNEEVLENATETTEEVA